MAIGDGGDGPATAVPTGRARISLHPGTEDDRNCGTTGGGTSDTVTDSHTIAHGRDPLSIPPLFRGPYPAPPSDFVVYQPGSMPLVLSAPHGGSEKPAWVPDLTNNRRHRVADALTLELAQMLASRIADLTGGRGVPYLVGNRLHRRKMDANREVNRATEGGSFATAVYGEYHAALERASQEAFAGRPAAVLGEGGGGRNGAKNGGGGMGLLIDLHGYAPPKAGRGGGHDGSWGIMVGHLISAAGLAVEDSALDGDADWVRGANSMGTVLCRHGLLAEPSATRRVPTAGKYFSGGYITRRYRELFGTVRTLQLEFPRSMRENLEEVVPKVAAAVVELMQNWNMLID